MMSSIVPAKASVSFARLAPVNSFTASVPMIANASVSREVLMAERPCRSVTWPTSWATTAASCSSVRQLW